MKKNKQTNKSNNIKSHKTAIISDVHSNYEALETIVAHAQEQHVDDVWFLGDVVGYGPEPHRCLKLLQEVVTHHEYWILGNHDQVMRYPPNGMNPDTFGDFRRNTSSHLKNQINPIVHYIGVTPDTLKAFRINYEILDAFPERRNFLLTHQDTSRPEVMGRRFSLVHGGTRLGTPTTTYTSDRIHVKEEFLVSIYKITPETLEKLSEHNLPHDLIKQLAGLENREVVGEDKFGELICSVTGDSLSKENYGLILQHAFFKQRPRYQDHSLSVFFLGHTHHPACFSVPLSAETDTNRYYNQCIQYNIKENPVIQLDESHAWFLNPGSVGQPRDGDPRASYMIFDHGDFTVQLHRVPYNIHATQKRMEDYGMPRNLIDRLSGGR